MRKLLLFMLVLSALTVKADDKATMLPAEGLYCGNVNLDVTETADGKYLLYDSKRNIYTVICASLPSVNEMVATGRLGEFSDMPMPENPTYNDLYNWTTNLTKNNKEGLTKFIMSAFEPIDPIETFNPYRLKSIRIEKLVDESGKSLMPKDIETFVCLRTDFVYGHSAESHLFDFLFMPGQDPVKLQGIKCSGFNQSTITIDGLADHERLIPREGATLTLSIVYTEDEELSFKGQSIFFVPNESGVSELENEGLKVIVTYEPAKSPLVDIHWGASRVYDYYKNVFGRESYDGQGAPVYNLFYLPGTNLGLSYLLRNDDEESDAKNAFMPKAPTNSTTDYEDEIFSVLRVLDQSGAFAESSTNPYTIMYGTGGYLTKDIFTRSMSELSILSHEFTHLVTLTTADLGGGSGEEGACDESFSDIMAISLMKSEYGYGKEYPWKVAANNAIVGKSGGRDLAEPEKSFDGTTPYPDTYEGTYWDEDDSYNMSSIQSHCYYLICEGGYGINDHGFSYSVDGIGIEKGQQIAYLALTKYAHKQFSMAESRKCFIAAAKELYGEGSAELTTVANAWDAVGVYDAESGMKNIHFDHPTARYLYDLQGRRVNNPHPGVYVRNGKKVVIKN